MPNAPEASDAPEAVSLDGVEGVFWFEGGPQKRGTLHLANSELKVITEGIARQPQSYRFPTTDGPGWRMDQIDTPEASVADYAPIPLLGTLDDGLKITVLDGRLAAEPPIWTQTILGTKLLVGAHAPTWDTTFAAARVALPKAAVWRGFFSGSAPVEVVELGDVTGELRATVEDRSGWLQLTLDEGFTETEWERRFWNRCLTLLRLWTNVPLREERVQLTLSADGAWADLIRVGGRVEPGSFKHWESLLPPQQLTIDTMAKALMLFDELAPISDVGSTSMVYEVTLELAVLANASCLEGLHRNTPGGARTFAKRLEELLPPVEYVAPGLIGQDRDFWISSVKNARNLEAHRFVKKPAERAANYDQRNDHYYQLAVSTEWVLRISLLLHIGLNRKVLHARLLDHRNFLFALANMDISRFPWPGSRLEEFRASREREADPVDDGE